VPLGQPIIDLRPSNIGYTDYIGRISRQFGLPESIHHHAVSLVEKSTVINGTSPITKACCSVIKAAESSGYKLARHKIASILGISTVGIKLALRRNFIDD
jgi:transcription initiation factor TFIIIB Brf1 subunit/transcription initiation factor TFIIB